LGVRNGAVFYFTAKRESDKVVYDKKKAEPKPCFPNL